MQNRTATYRRVAGFTMMEIIVVIAVIGIIMGIVIPQIRRTQTQAKRTAAEINLKKIQTQLEIFNSTFGRYPADLRELVDRPADPKVAQRWTQLLDEKEVKDPWGTAYFYQATPGKGPGQRPYQLYSWGPNGEGSEEGTWVDVWNTTL